MVERDTCFDEKENRRENERDECDSPTSAATSFTWKILVMEMDIVGCARERSAKFDERKIPFQNVFRYGGRCLFVYLLSLINVAEQIRSVWRRIL